MVTDIIKVNTAYISWFKLYCFILKMEALCSSKTTVTLPVNAAYHPTRLHQYHCENLRWPHHSGKENSRSKEPNHISVSIYLFICIIMLSVVHSTALNGRMISAWWNEKEFWSVHDLIAGSCVVFIRRNRGKLERNKLTGVMFHTPPGWKSEVILLEPICTVSLYTFVHTCTCASSLVK